MNEEVPMNTPTPSPGAKKRLLNIDLTAWQLGEWPEDLWKAVSIEKTSYSLEINIDESLFHSIVRKIIHEAIETYMNDAMFYLFDDGLHILETNSYKTEVTIPWDGIYVQNQAAIEAAKAHIKECEDKMEGEE